MTFQITTVYADGTTETRNATEEEVAQREADALAMSTDFTLVLAQRNSLLAASDWTQLPDSPLSDEEKTAWSEYRQQLRDMPSSFTTVDEVVWPKAP